MRSFLLTIFVLLISSTIAQADYTTKNVYKFENSDMIKNHDGSNIVNASGVGIAEDSNGNKSVLKCLVNISNGMLSGHCQSTDQDGDVEYTAISRDMSKGPQGTFTRTGGTGKYANTGVTCEYVVELTDFQVGVGYLTATCKE
ncbi:uncharacterized protein METZ01_LOCUS344940 [marine metagenome]|uniref:Uncharacterized protein n=1 Tax=marine metagenome TaxID=408172 RepID=A0A382R326_9ZZZZ